ncbi:hypothetical protein BDZ90DRAFT_215549 [Jaminaea rosea]|uniref:Uncharacterized protein n=1 Tax=Jaminaea rosea TaxID=1569628 RepID=A0A316UXL3_9BASI|nr:hypothetical protein BDZ90DRAFT_215549 [Jaminaea rosea]PWN30050.1 hypothetical protein BDZ90DRAFT_215549 [Jaminaea rosea]
MSDDIEDADEDDFKTSIKFGKKRSASGPSRSKQRIEDEDDSDSELSYIEDEAEDLLAKPRAKGRQRRAPRKSAASLQDREFDGDDDYEDSEDSEDEDFVGASTSANPSSARGLHGEDIRYETFKQRQARLKSERHLARRKKVPKLTPYQKTVQSLGKHHPELVGLWDDLKQTSGAPKNVATVQPNGLKATLLPFQLEGLNWLLEQEKGPWSGGVLADEMGMGKTIQMISLFLSNRDKPTLVVAPVVAIMQWRNEIAKYTDGFKVLVWHGASREVDAKKLAQHDVVLTSYSVMEASFRKQEIGFKRKKELVKEKSALHAVQWHRVVLDEAHNIKDRATNTAKAAFELSSTYRWCLSGTPLMNRVGELYSMIRFLNGDPYGYYYCKQCPCKSLHWQFSDRRSCDKCGHTPMHHVCFWNISVLRPIQRDGTSVGEGGEAFRRLRILLDRMMLRRTKLERADDMGLPPRTVVVRKDYFNEEEEDLYDSLYNDGARKFSTFVSQGTILNNYSNIFTLITRMRQLSCHPDLVLRSKTGVAKKLLGDASNDTINLCRICAEEATEPIVSKCKHVFCRECVRQYLESASEEVPVPDCPYCHANLSINLDQEALEDARPEETRQGILGRLDVANWRSSTKIEALVEELNKVRRDDSTIKSIVFSQFTSFLDLIAFRLQRAGFTIARLEGSMTPEARDRTVRYFSDNPSVTVFLVSLKAGGVALNLTEASRVFVMDPWWNAASIGQAADRIHRLGQTRPIIITNLIIENSIESRVAELSAKKMAMVNATLSNDDAASQRLTVADLQFLFRM